MCVLLHAFLWLATPAVVAHAAAEPPDSAELEASAAVLDASAPEAHAAAPSTHSHLLEISWSTLITANDGAPETNLQLDNDG